MFETIRLNNAEYALKYMNTNVELIKGNDKIKKKLLKCFSNEMPEMKKIFLSWVYENNIDFSEYNEYKDLVNNYINEICVFGQIKLIDTYNSSMPDLVRKQIINRFVEYGDSSSINNFLKNAFLTDDKKHVLITKLIKAYNEEYVAELFYYVLYDYKDFCLTTIFLMLGYIVNYSSNTIPGLFALFKDNDTIKSYLLDAIKKSDKKIDDIGRISLYISHDEKKKLAKVINHRYKESGNTEEVFSYMDYVEDVSESTQKLFTKTLKEGSTYDVINFTKYDLDRYCLNEIAAHICTLEEVSDIYQFLALNYDKRIKEEYKKTLVNKLLRSNNYYYIACFCLFVDQRYIEKLFTNKKQLLFILNEVDMIKNPYEEQNRIAELEKREKIKRSFKKNVKRYLKENE